MNILLIDNYDSFTYNLYHYLMEIGASVQVFRNDCIDIQGIKKEAPQAIIMSPGPCTPNEAGICLDIVSELKTEFPMLGVCLGHQSIAQAFGGSIIRGTKPMHAQVSPIFHQQHPLFHKIPSPFNATRYHSLIVEKESLPEELSIIGTSEDGVIQALCHTTYPIYGVQFHPESIASDFGHTLLRNFLQLTKQFHKDCVR